jgi:hypothetical protein
MPPYFVDTLQGGFSFHALGATLVVFLTAHRKNVPSPAFVAPTSKSKHDNNPVPFFAYFFYLQAFLQARSQLNE